MTLLFQPDHVGDALLEGGVAVSAEVAVEFGECLHGEILVRR